MGVQSNCYSFVNLSAWAFEWPEVTMISNLPVQRVLNWCHIDIRGFSDSLQSIMTSPPPVDIVLPLPDWLTVACPRMWSLQFMDMSAIIDIIDRLQFLVRETRHCDCRWHLVCRSALRPPSAVVFNGELMSLNELIMNDYAELQWISVGVWQ